MSREFETEVIDRLARIESGTQAGREAAERHEQHDKERFDAIYKQLAEQQQSRSTWVRSIAIGVFTVILGAVVAALASCG